MKIYAADSTINPTLAKLLHKDMWIKVRVKGKVDLAWTPRPSYFTAADSNFWIRLCDYSEGRWLVNMQYPQDNFPIPVNSKSLDNIYSSYYWVKDRDITIAQPREIYKTSELFPLALDADGEPYEN